MGATVEPRGSTSNVISLSPGLSPFDVRQLYTTAGLLPSTPHTSPTPLTSVFFGVPKGKKRGRVTKRAPTVAQQAGADKFVGFAPARVFPVRLIS